MWYKEKQKIQALEGRGMMSWATIGSETILDNYYVKVRKNVSAK
jgi:hypothetical protein